MSGTDQACSLKDVEMPGSQRLAEQQSLREVEHAQPILAGKLVQNRQPVYVRYRLEKGLEVEHRGGLFCRQYRGRVLLDTLSGALLAVLCDTMQRCYSSI